MKISALFFLVSVASTAAFAPNNVNSRTTDSRLHVITDSERFDLRTGRNYDSMMGPRGGSMTPYYRGSGNDYYPRVGEGMETKIEGNSRRTFDTTYSDSTQVTLETDGRPLDAQVEVWEGPSNTPAKMKLWSEDGRMRPWGPVGFGNMKGGYGYGGSSGSSMTVDNKAGSEFPMYAQVYQQGRYMGTSRRNTIRVDGNGAQKSFTMNGPCIIEIWSEGFPYFANIEVWEGPNNIKQSAEVYADNGMDRPFSAVVEGIGRGGTIQIRNPGPLEYPILVSVEPLGGGYSGSGYGYDNYGYY